MSEEAPLQANQPKRTRAVQDTGRTGSTRTKQSSTTATPAQETAAPLVVADITGSAAPHAFQALEPPARATLDEPSIGELWGEFPPLERCGELKRMLEAWDQETNHKGRSGPFSEVKLTGADVFWLAERTKVAANLVNKGQKAVFKPLLSELNLQRANLMKAQMQQADLWGADLKDATLEGAQLEEAFLRDMQFQGALLSGAHMQRAILEQANLQGAALEETNLEGASFLRADLKQAYLFKARIQGANLFQARLSGACLREAFMDADTNLAEAILDQRIEVADTRWNGVSLSRIEWGSVTHLGDEEVARQLRETLPDEKGDSIRVQKQRTQRISEFQSAIRANRQLAFALRSQGMNEIADRFAYRAQVLSRELLWLETGLPTPGFKQYLAHLKDESLPNLRKQPQQLHFWHIWQDSGPTHRQQQQKDWRCLRILNPTTWPAWLWHRPLWEWGLFVLVLGLVLGFSLSHWWSGLVAVLGLSLVLLILRQPHGRKLLSYLFALMLGVLAGYGYRPGRALGWYLVVISGFALVYAALGHLPVFPDALVLSLTSFHGRGFFPGLGTTPSLHNPLVVSAALEAVIGLFIEISFIATFTQRFFGR